MDKTLGQLEHFYFLPKMRVHVQKYVNKCRLCEYVKGRCQNVELYTPLPFPSRPWDSVSMDFVSGLPIM